MVCFETDGQRAPVGKAGRALLAARVCSVEPSAIVTRRGCSSQPILQPGFDIPVHSACQGKLPMLRKNLPESCVVLFYCVCAEHKMMFKLINYLLRLLFLFLPVY